MALESEMETGQSVLLTIVLLNLSWFRQWWKGNQLDLIRMLFCCFRGWRKQQMMLILGSRISKR